MSTAVAKMPRMGRKKTDRHKSKLIGIRPTPKLWNIFCQLAKKNRRTRTAEAELAIEMYLDKHWVDWREAPMVDLDKLSE